MISTDGTITIHYSFNRNLDYSINWRWLNLERVFIAYFMWLSRKTRLLVPQFNVLGISDDFLLILILTLVLAIQLAHSNTQRCSTSSLSSSLIYLPSHSIIPISFSSWTLRLREDKNQRLPVQGQSQMKWASVSFSVLHLLQLVLMSIPHLARLSLVGKIP